MNTRGCSVVFVNQFRYYVHLRVVLITVVNFVALLRPTGVHVLVALLVLVVLPEVVDLSFLYLLVLIAGITLTGRLHEACIDNLSFGKNQALACLESAPGRQAIIDLQIQGIIRYINHQIA